MVHCLCHRAEALRIRPRREVFAAHALPGRERQRDAGFQLAGRRCSAAWAGGAQVREVVDAGSASCYSEAVT